MKYTFFTCMCTHCKWMMSIESQNYYFITHDGYKKQQMRDLWHVSGSLVNECNLIGIFTCFFTCKKGEIIGLKSFSTVMQRDTAVFLFCFRLLMKNSITVIASTSLCTFHTQFLLIYVRHLHQKSRHLSPKLKTTHITSLL